MDHYWHSQSPSANFIITDFYMVSIIFRCAAILDRDCGRIDRRSPYRRLWRGERKLSF